MTPDDSISATTTESYEKELIAMAERFEARGDLEQAACQRRCAANIAAGLMANGQPRGTR